MIIATIHLIVSVLLGICIMVQNRSSGLSAALGGSGAGAVVQRRGAEKVIFKATVWLVALFFGIAILRWFL